MDRSNKKFSFVIITFIIGFMIAVQFQTVQKPIERDTRDIWQLREALLKEKELETNLLKEIRSNDEKIDSYESKKKQSKEETLKNTLQELKVEAGMTEVNGPGIILKIEPVMENIRLGEPVTKVISPDLLKRLLNELNMYEAKYVSIDDQRVINTTVIRDINSDTKIDGHTIKSLPIEVKIIAESKQIAEKLYNRMQGSKSTEEFFIDNLKLTISPPSENITIPAYDNPIHIRYMEPVKDTKGGKS